MVGVGTALAEMWTALDLQFYELERLLRYQAEKDQPLDLIKFGRMRSPPDTNTVRNRLYVDAFIAWAFITLLDIICLLHVFSKL
jgi:hypothetical protein